MTNHKGHVEEEIWFSAVSEEELAKYDKDAAYAVFRKRVAASRQPRRVKHRFGWLRYAAAAAAIVAVGYFSFKGGQSDVTSTFGDIVVEAPQGSRTQMTLPDGTKVWLNAGSKMSYSQGFGTVNRSVVLVGEGYFEVAHNEQLPFSVASEDVRVSVLGTKFNFRDYPTDANAIVSLAEGRVALDMLHANGETVYLKPDQRAVVEKETGRINVVDCEVARSVKWTRGYLLFNGEPLAEIVKDLERSYDVEVTIKDPTLLNLHFYGSFVRQEQSIGEVLDALSATHKIKYKMEGHHITLY